MTLMDSTRLLTLATRLKLARVGADLEQADIAAQLGISRTSVSNYETGRSEPNATVFVRWAAATGVTLEWLAEGVQSMYTPRDSNPEPTDYGLGALANGSLAAGLLLVRAILSAVRA